MLSFTPKKLTDEEFAAYQSAYEQEVSGDAAARDKAWGELHAFFRDKNSAQDREWYSSFFRWYTDLTWKRFRDLTFEETTEIGFRRQIPMALLLGFDVLDEFLWYANWNSLVSDHIREVYVDARTAYNDSNAYFGTYKGKEYVMNQILEEIDRLEQTTADTYEIATWYGQMEEMLKSIVGSGAVNRFPADPLDQVVKRFVELHAFFVEISDEEIPSIVFSYVHQDWFVGPQGLPSPAETEERDRIDQIRVGAEAIRDIAKGNPEAPAKSTVEPAVKTTAPSPSAPAAPNKKIEQRAPSYNVIRKQIESEFSFGADGQPEDVADVIARLDALAAQYGDEKITELFYFNENSGRFEWNV